MKVSWNWLREFVDIDDLKPTELATRLTFAGLQVESVDPLRPGLSSVVVGRILSRVPHPAADKLGVCEVDAGVHGTRQIVCGAPNARAGLVAPLALPGATVAGRSIQPVEMRGVRSDGMLCSARELELDADATGLLELAEALVPGTPLASALGLDDVILDISITPNRADALSILGVARDVAALLDRPLRRPALPLPPEQGASCGDRVRLEVRDAAGCPRYAFAVVDGLGVGPSPEWVQRRLEAVGQRPVNNLVDVTNYVLFELGQPLHAFDISTLRGQQIEVRRAAAGETLIALDGSECSLVADDLVICDAQGPVALAGVMGGANSEIRNSTTSVLIECANFGPAGVRKTARRLGMRTESSYRFERGVDVSGIPAALQRAVELLAAVGGAGVTCAPGPVDTVAQPYVAPTIMLRDGFCGAVLGLAVDRKTSAAMLRRLGLEVADGPEGLLVTVPASRPDLTRPIDLVEEIGRLIGYDAVPSSLPPGVPGLDPVRRSDAPVVQVSQPIVPDVRLRAVQRARESLVALGLSEAVNWGFGDPAQQQLLLGEVELLGLKNPLGRDTSVMRRTLLAGLLANVRHNQARGQDRVALFELGRVFPTDADGDLRHEPELLSGVLTGPRRQGWHADAAAFDIHDAAAAVEAVAHAVQRRVILTDAHSEEPPRWAHPGSVARVVCDGSPVGWLATVHPDVAQRWDIEAPVHAFELDLSAMLEVGALNRRFARIARHPGSRRDLAVVVDRAQPHARVAEVLSTLKEPLLESVELFDVYTGTGIAPDHKSVALALVYRDAEASLTDEQVDAAHQRVTSAVLSGLNGVLR